MSFKQRFPWLFYRKLNVDILTLFLSLICISFAVVISFTYSQYSKSIFALSQGTVTRVAEIVIQRLSCFLHNVENVPITGSSLTLDISDVSSNNRHLEQYFLREIKYRQYFSGLYVGVDTGFFMGACNLSRYAMTHYLSDPSKPLPKESVFAIYVINHSDNTTEQIWKYKDENFNTVGSEIVTNQPFDPRERPWYLGAEKTRSLFWTDVYHYAPSGIKGISVGKPLYNPQGQFFGALCMDISLAFLGEFLQEQSIGHAGVVGILDSSGDSLIDLPENNEDRKEVFKMAYQNFQKTQSKTFVFESNGVHYLNYIDQFPITHEKHWMIVISVPLTDFFQGLIDTQRIVVFMTLGILVVVGIVVIYRVRKISDPIVQLAEEVDKIQRLDLSSQVRIRSHIVEVNLLDTSISAMRIALRSFAKYVPKEIVKQLFLRGHEITLEGEKKEMTVFFSDIEGFTLIADTLPTEELMTLLSGYFDSLSKVILKSGGTIDKYIGDSIMAFWGAPTHFEDHVARACITALACQEAVDAFNQKQKRRGKTQLPTSFGLNTGNVIVGNIGTSERMNYTVIGDVVNVAARLQKLHQYYKAGIIISEAIYELMKGRFLIRPADYTAIRGKKEKLNVFHLMASLNKETGLLSVATERQKILCAQFTAAYHAYWAGQLQEAKTQFEYLHAEFPEDTLTSLYLERLSQ